MTLSPDPNPVEHAAFLRCLYDITHGSAGRLVYVEQVTKAMHLDEVTAESIVDALVVEDLVRLRLQCILSITEAGIAEVKAALHKYDGAARSRTTQQPTLSHSAPTPEPPRPKPSSQPPVRTSLSHSLLGAGGFDEDSVIELPLPPPPPAVSERESDELELKLICEAIGLDPRELGGAPRPPATANGRPVAAHSVPSKPPPILETGDVAKTLTSLMLLLPKLGLGRDELAEAEAEIATSTAQLLSPRPKQPIIASSLTTLLAILDGARGPALTSDLQRSLTEIRLFLTHLQA